MARDKEDSDIDKNTSYWQQIKSSFAGDSSAQMAKKRQYMQQNKQEQLLSNQNAPVDAQGEALRRQLQKTSDGQ